MFRIPIVYGVHVACRLLNAQIATITRKIEQEPHWVSTLDQASAGFEVASA